MITAKLVGGPRTGKNVRIVEVSQEIRVPLSTYEAHVEFAAVLGQTDLPLVRARYVLKGFSSILGMNIYEYVDLVGFAPAPIPQVIPGEES